MDPASFSDLPRARERAYSPIDLSTGPADSVDSFFHSVSRTALSENPAARIVGEKTATGKIAALAATERTTRGCHVAATLQ